MKRLFTGGRVVSGSAVVAADVLVDGEKIVSVAPHIDAPDAEVVDVTGKLLLPGFIDAHTHFDLDVCNTTTADDFESGSRSALRGGTTTVIDFACPNKGETLAYGLELWHKKAADCHCDYGFHMTIDDWNEGIEAELDDMFAAGITSFKMYMTYPAMMLPDGDLYRALKALKARGGICGVHCENSGVIDALVAEKKAKGENAVSCHPQTRPDYLEAEAVGRILRIAQAAEAPVVIVHTTNAAALSEIDQARARGQVVYSETCPQYLALDDSVYYQEDWLSSAKFVCSPPIRKKADQDALWAGLKEGRVNTVSTDHCSFTTQQKLAGQGDFTTIPGGLPGVETRARWCTPPAWRRAASTCPPCAGHSARIPPSCTVSIPARAASRPVLTPISWCTIRRRITPSTPPTWCPAATIRPSRASEPPAASPPCTCGACPPWKTASSAT